MHVKHGSAHATDCSQIAKAAVSGKAICKQLMLVAQMHAHYTMSSPAGAASKQVQASTCKF